MCSPVPQPALAELRLRRITNRAVARATDYTPHWVGRVLLGHVPPSAEFRKRLSDFLGLPEDRLFRETS
jgi:transcriptional regulator with XRE-family HTH domain